MRVMIELRPDEQQALVELAARERRHPRDQAAILVRENLVRRGLLKESQPAEPFAEVRRNGS